MRYTRYAVTMQTTRTKRCDQMQLLPYHSGTASLATSPSPLHFRRVDIERQVLDGRGDVFGDGDVVDASLTSFFVSGVQYRRQRLGCMTRGKVVGPSAGEWFLILGAGGVGGVDG